jgi:hypothetical protein
MPIPRPRIPPLLARLNSPELANLYAQAHARFVLNEVGEEPENFPPFDPALDDKVTFAAYALLAGGCSLIEQGDRPGGAETVERAAALLTYIHAPATQTSRESAFHMLVAAMAFFASGQYSRAFVAIRNAEQQTAAARIIGALLRKEMPALVAALNAVLLAEVPTLDDQFDVDEWAITTAIARTTARWLETMLVGAEQLQDGEQDLQDAAFVASNGRHPAWWWVIRLFRLMLGDLREASPWFALPPLFGDGDRDLLTRFTRLLAFARRPITELWLSQRAALPLALDLSNHGAVINLRTSAGKTRVAELAILRVLCEDANARILYLAPFRSLAFEVEQTLAATFGRIGFGVSHLYGGARISAVDQELLEESVITIATPEKARALLRATPEALAAVKLIVVDEGHLVGASERFVRNELFVDHLRALARATHARILVLSAVLPNPADLAEWVAGDRNAVAKSSWKPSAERFGLLRWNGTCVRIDWKGDVQSSNPAFVEAAPLGFSRRRLPFPNDKNEAVAATAVRMSSIGPVMIFTGRAVSVPTLATAVLLALGEHPAQHPWPDYEWRVFEAVCTEELEQDAIELRAARAGVICHSNRLAPQVRLAMEHLMRSTAPRIIVATTTLAQGVNVGIATVIIATPYISQETISKRDFWNICGRAGRAFVDGEGKILYAIDDTRERWQIRRDERLAAGYFDASSSDPVESGLLFVVRGMRRLAVNAGVRFDRLLELAAENDFSALGQRALDCEALCDLIDDELLALEQDSLLNLDTDDARAWVEDVFRNSLAVLQARSGAEGIGSDDVLAFLAARVESVMERVAPHIRGSVARSGLPLSVAIRSQADLDEFEAIADALDTAESELDVLSAGVKKFEEWVRVNGGPLAEGIAPEAALDAVRDGWLGGVALQLMAQHVEEAAEIAKSFYGYQLPWLIHAVSQQLRSAGNEEAADTLARVALLVELGVPTSLAARLFLAGIRSRAAATELSQVHIDFGDSVGDAMRRLRDDAIRESLRDEVTDATAVWLDLIGEETSRWRGGASIPSIKRFRLKGVEGATRLHARALGQEIFLCTADGTIRQRVKATRDLPFDRNSSPYPVLT